MILNNVLESQAPSARTSAQPRDMPAAAPSARGWISRAVREFALQDWLVLAYLSILTFAVAVRPASPARATCLGHIAPVLVVSAIIILTVRSGLLKGRFVAPLSYRLAVHGTVQMSYFLLRELLPIASPGCLDAQLAQIDMKWLHFEPSLWLERFATPAATEWFAFFYFGYFTLLTIHVVPIVYFSKRTGLLAEFALGVLLCFGIGHICYMLVPGFGPVQYLAGEFQHPLPDGFWMRLVMTAVDSGGAQKDIFPSIHTAVPVFIALFSYRHRDQLPFKYTWPLVAFFAANIVIATMFLRWHYLVDVLAGLVLSTSVFAFCARVSPREVLQREQRGLTPVWPALFGPRSP